MNATTSPSPLAIPHILLQTLSYASPQTLSRCMCVSTFWYDTAASHLWARVSYRVNPYLNDPGVTPFLPIPPGDQLRGLRRAKRLAMRHVKVVEMRKHDCLEVGCENMTLHAEEDEDVERLDRNASPAGLGAGGVPVSAGILAATGLESAGFRRLNGYQNLRHPVLASLRLHIDDKQLLKDIGDPLYRPRPIPFPCPFVNKLDTSTLVLVPLRQLSNDRLLPLPSPPSLRKLVILLIPPTAQPGEYRLADSVPAKVEDVVIFLWRRHAASRYDHFRGSWGSQMAHRRWGPDKIWGHWCNFIISASPAGSETLGSKTRTRRYTFVGTGDFEPLWLSMADGSTHRKEPLGEDSRPDPALYAETQRRFEKGMRECLAVKIQEAIQARRTRDDLQIVRDFHQWEAQVKDSLDNVRFMSTKEYQAEEQWYGDFTQDEIAYHG